MAEPKTSGLHRSVRDPAAFDGVYRAHSRTVLLFLTRRTYDPEVALDLMAETFAQAFSSRRRFRGSDTDDERAWLLGIARHLLGRYLRKGVAERRALRRLGLEVPEMDSEDYARIVDLAGLTPLRAAVAAELHALGPDQQQAIRLRIVDELPYPSIALRLGVSEPTVRARVSRGLRTIASALEQQHEIPQPESAS